MLTEQSTVDLIQILEDGQIQVRTANVVLRDSVEIAKTYHRHVLSPGDDLTHEDTRVRAQAMTAWTPAIIAAWKAKT